MIIIFVEKQSKYDKLKPITKKDIKVGKVLYNCKLQPCKITAIGKEKFLFKRTNRNQCESDKYISYALAKWKKE